MPSDLPAPLDVGLLAPVRAGTRAERETSDAAWLQALLDAEAALARAQGLDLDLSQARPDPADLAVRARGAGNPVVPLVADLRATAGPAVHRGATSQDIMDTATMLVAHRTRAVVLADLDRTTAALAELAAAHRRTPMAGRTLAQQAVPTTFGLLAATWLVACLDAGSRLAAVALPVQFGGAAGTLAGYGPGALALMAAVAAETGLAEPVLPWHTDRTPVVALAEALAAVTGALGKLGTDVVLLAQSEVGELAEPAAPGRGGSSAMAHKRNPVLATMIRSAALVVPGQLAVLHTARAGAALQRPAGEWHAEWQPLRECLRLAGGAAETAAELTGGLRVRTEAMAANLAGLLPELPEPDRGIGHAPALVDRALAYYRERRESTR